MGGANFRNEGTNLLFGKIFAKNLHENKKKLD